MVEVHSSVDGCGGVLPEDGTVFRVEQQGSVEHIQKEHDLITPRVLARHTQKHLLQQLDPQNLVQSVHAKEFFAWIFEYTLISRW